MESIRHGHICQPAFNCSEDRDCAEPKGKALNFTVHKAMERKLPRALTASSRVLAHGIPTYPFSMTINCESAKDLKELSIKYCLQNKDSLRLKSTTEVDDERKRKRPFILCFLKLKNLYTLKHKRFECVAGKVYQYEYLLSFSSIPGKDASPKPMFQDGDLLTLHPALGVGQQQPQPDGHEGAQAPQGVVGGGLNELFGLVLLLVEHVLVLHREVVAVAAGHRVAEGLPLQRQLPGSDVHDLHVLRAVHRMFGGQEFVEYYHRHPYEAFTTPVSGPESSSESLANRYQQSMHVDLHKDSILHDKDIKDKMQNCGAGDHTQTTLATRIKPTQKEETEAALERNAGCLHWEQGKHLAKEGLAGMQGGKMTGVVLAAQAQPALDQASTLDTSGGDGVSTVTQVVKPSVAFKTPLGHRLGILQPILNNNTLEQAEKALLAVVELLKDPKVAASLQKLSGKQSAEACVLKGNKSKGLKTQSEKPSKAPHKEDFCSNTQRDQLVCCMRPFEHYRRIASAFFTAVSVYHGECPSWRSTMFSCHGVPIGWHHSSWKLEVTTEPPTTGGMTVHTGQKYTAMSAKTMIQKLSRAMQEVVLTWSLTPLLDGITIASSQELKRGQYRPTDVKIKNKAAVASISECSSEEKYRNPKAESYKVTGQNVSFPTKSLISGTEQSFNKYRTNKSADEAWQREKPSQDKYYIILFKYKDEEDKEGRTAADTIVAAVTVPAFSPEPSWKRTDASCHMQQLLNQDDGAVSNDGVGIRLDPQINCSDGQCKNSMKTSNPTTRVIRQETKDQGEPMKLEGALSINGPSDAASQASYDLHSEHLSAWGILGSGSTNDEIICSFTPRMYSRLTPNYRRSVQKADVGTSGSLKANSKTKVLSLLPDKQHKICIPDSFSRKSWSGKLNYPNQKRREAGKVTAVTGSTQIVKNKQRAQGYKEGDTREKVISTTAAFISNHVGPDKENTTEVSRQEKDEREKAQEGGDTGVQPTCHPSVADVTVLRGLMGSY
ncbi:hypothetical protein EI555_002841 [Monodon monoceros]|uniref:Uncharacterized protein n=1 Tax=Monodon monoceros TaxID=40151 RepID=A0A4U1EG08_MONMO|nr:hypothetical protein EI555_002841 [Monodon monoceros]